MDPPILIDMTDSSPSTPCCSKKQQAPSCCDSKDQEVCASKKSCCSEQSVPVENACSKAASPCCSNKMQEDEKCVVAAATVSEACCTSSKNCGTTTEAAKCCEKKTCQKLEQIVTTKEAAMVNCQEQQTSTIHVQGMSCCASCGKTIEVHLGALKGVFQVKTYYSLEKCQVVHDPSVVSTNYLLQQVEQLGFGATPMVQDTSNSVTLQVRDSATKKQLCTLPGVLAVRELPSASQVQVTYNPDETGPRTITEHYGKGKIGLVQEEAGQVKSRGTDKDLWKQSFILSLCFTIPIAILAYIVPIVAPVHKLFSLSFHRIPMSTILQAMLCTPVQTVIAWPILKSAYQSVRYAHIANMDLLISISTWSAFVYSWCSMLYAVVSDTEGQFFFETSAILLSLVMLGRFLEVTAIASTNQALNQLLKLQSPVATLLEPKKAAASCCASKTCGKSAPEYKERQIDISMVQRNDVLLVKAGERIPTDGKVFEGETSIDESPVTGESIPVFKTKGSRVIGGTMNQHGVIQMQVTRTMNESILSSICHLVEEAQATKMNVQRTADQVASYFVPSILVLATVTFLFWFMVAQFNVLPSIIQPKIPAFPFALMFAMTVLIISCPCAVSLAVPTAVTVATGVAAKYGVLFKSTTAMEIAHKATTIVFDKTGTLTEGKPSISSCTIFEPSLSEEDFLLRVASAEAGLTSQHVVAQAVIEFAKKKFPSQKLISLASFESMPGLGVVCSLGDGVSVIVGNTVLMRRQQVSISLDQSSTIETLEREANTVICVAFNKVLVGILSMQDSIRPESIHVIRELKKLNMKVVMMSGDNQQTANAVAQQLDITSVYGELLPQGKYEQVKALQHQGEQVIFVGDGINDSVSLAQADVGIALGSGTDVAMEASSVVLMKNDLRDVLVALLISKACFQRIKFNFVWAFVYNLIGIPLAMGALFPLVGIAIHPSIAGISEVFSSIPVILSSLWLRRFVAPARDSSL